MANAVKTPMVELVVLDADFSVLGIIDGYETLIWTRKYYETGTFELHCGDRYFSLLANGAFLFRADRPELGILRGATYMRDNLGTRKAVARGSFAESLLSDRVFAGVYHYGGTAEMVVRNMVNDLCIEPSDPDRVIPNLVLGDAAGLGTEIDGQVTGDALHDKIRDICAEQELSIRITLDYLTNLLTFTVWQGKDRTQNQTENTWATFSDDYENIIASEIRAETTGYKNVAYVAGEGEDADRIIEVVDQSDGQDRRELWVDARDIQKEKEGGGTYTESEYRALLRQRGVEKLAEYNTSPAINCELDTGADTDRTPTNRYLKDFDLGDLCTFVDHEHGILAETRITEIVEVYERGAYNVTATIGQAKMNIKKYIDRGLRKA